MTIESLGLTVGQAAVAGAIGILLAVVTDRYRNRREPKTTPPKACFHCGNPAPATTPEFCPRCGAFVRHREPCMDERYAPFHNAPGGIINFGSTTAMFASPTNPRPFKIINHRW